ncbi:DinB family protein [Flavobacterium terrisoli]|uniref:DinB family protein n=1 Tax=Flavobacterium terrisoli TaxID=3242195 RepID=UPI002542D58A|nr:DinB family protein [Flavobacterium buctense]
MKEPKRICSLYQKLYNGSPWIEITITGVLENITAGQAAKKALPNANTIWEITNHIISWRNNVLRRVQGEVITTPNNNYIEPVEDTSADAWKNTLERLEVSQTAWINFLNDFNENDFENIYPNNEMTYYEHIQGIIQHDCYHLGQIVILAKMVS